jgi:protein-L-isoaspartate O-methyltransferase
MPIRERRSLAGLVVLFTLVATISISSTGALRAQEEEFELADYDSLKTLFDEALTAKEYDKALDLGEKISWLVGEKHFEMIYEMARICAAKGEKLKAYNYLQAAADAGYWNAKQIMEDEAFLEYKGEKRLKQVARAAWSNGYIWLLERDERDEFQMPERVMETLAFEKGETVADIGAGTGYFTLRIAEAVGPEGRVLAHDISEEMLDYLEKQVTAAQLENVELKRVEPDDPLLPEEGVNTILMVDTIHYVKDRAAYGKKLLEGLAPDGRLIIIDFVPKPMSERPWGPPPQQQFPKEQLHGELAEAGFEVVEEHDFLPEQFIAIYRAK